MNENERDFSSDDAMPPPEPGAADSIPVEVCRRLTARQTRAIEALMSSPSIAAASKACKVSESAIHRWLKNEAFQSVYLETRRRSFAQAIAISQREAPTAISCLLKIMLNSSGRNKSREADQIAAAKTLLKYSRDSIEIDDISLRLQKLEEGRN